MRKRFHGLKRPKARADMSKENLYNISRMQIPYAATKTFFQQKWNAKSLTRGYHGEMIREGQWTRMFDRRLPSVVPLDHHVLARTDGSDQAAGRGSGLDVDPKGGVDAKGNRKRAPAKTPYMHMTYWPVERRLDTAVWRSLFASSARQARQFVVHGFVRVNGKKMIYPGYLLNPGDMFSVEPERVLFATGARKHNKNVPDTLQGQVTTTERETFDDNAEEVEGAEDVQAAQEAEEAAAAAKIAETPSENPKDTLQLLLRRAKTILADQKKQLSGKRQQDLRDFSRSVKKTLSKIRGTYTSSSTPIDDTIDSLEETLSSITGKIPSESGSSETTSPPTAPITSSSDPNATPTSTTSTTPSAPPASSNPQSDASKPDLHNARRDAQLLHAALQRAQENPIDVRKGYATPWRPREFMSAFAFIPRYLEVNQNICAAVYLRHPVARPGLAEVPTPFHGETMALAHNWYLRRR